MMGWKRTEFRYGTLYYMARCVKSGIWKIADRENKENITESDILAVFDRAMELAIANEASGSQGFNPNGALCLIDLYERDDGRVDEIRCSGNALDCLVEGMWPSLERRTLYFNLQARGISVSHFSFLDEKRDGFIPVRDLMDHDITVCNPNVRRFFYAFYSRPFVYLAHLVDSNGVGLLDYDPETRTKTINEARKMG